MIDFRYHIVSLLSVFLALAIGIILGAGPLQNSIGEALSSEMNVLRGNNDTLRKENDFLKARNTAQEAAINDVGASLLEQTLTGQNVALVVLPRAEKEYVTQIADTLKKSGANVNSVIEIKPVWANLDSANYRSQLADKIKTVLPENSGTSTATDVNFVFTQALRQIISMGTEDVQNAELMKILNTAQKPIFEVKEGTKSATANVVIVAGDEVDLTPNKDKVQDPKTVEKADYAAKSYLGFTKIVGENFPTVVAGVANSQNDLVMMVRTADVETSTVDSLDEQVGKINVPLALAAELTGKTVNYGFAETADKIIGPRIVIPAPEMVKPNAKPNVG